ncbi:SDR family NAD(P)-dependent oxidoreductase [Bosea sp. (in: a-proteobacteria)]|uniref:SDR family NAD(P)-dependent oxidoreductase n=1 Tax=Bosea sp. (in: a-proteobacteria) TaxID=1871050 RepID=UPI002FC90078
MKALVAGASRGIGAAIAIRLAQDGMTRSGKAEIAITARERSEALDEVAAAINAIGGKAHIITGDMGDPAVPGRVASEAAEACGGLVFVVANAGITSPGPLASLALESWERLFAVNTRGPWLLAQGAHQALRASKGSFVAVASMSGMFPHPGAGAYSSTKAALIMLCQQLAFEWGPDGIRVNAVCPGMIRTPMTETIYADPAIAARRDEIVPLQRVGQPDDIARVVSFLGSDDARYVTGEAIRADGGFSSSILSYVPGLPKSR